MQCGNILDAYVDPTKNVMVTWLTDEGNAYRIEDSFEPTFYVSSSQDRLFNLASKLQDIPQVKHLNFTQSLLTVGSQKKTLVLEITPKTIDSLHKLAGMIDFWGHYKDFELYNVDIRLSTRYLQHKGVFCNAWVKWDGKRFLLEDEQWAVDYAFPQFTTLFLDVKRHTSIPSLEDPLASIQIDNEQIEEGDEADTLRSALQLIRKKDPDLIYSHEGDSFLFPYLYHRARQCGMSKEINFGRERRQRKRPVKQAKSYFSYGQIVFRPAFYTLQGRAHIDKKSSFLYDESGLCGLVDISRCSNIPLQLQSRLGPGTAISQMQINKALENGFLICWKKNLPENCKSAKQLLISDRGGLILSPDVGLHEDVVELDFASLYPNIMLRFNISPETMLCSCCPDSLQRVPQLGYHICSHKQGFIPEVLKPILYRRFCFKARMKNKKYDPAVYQELQQAWKWILIVCFGYTGYRNARFGRIECHESITAYARDILLDAIEVAEHAGYQVFHGIIDSLWVKPVKDTVTPYQLTRNIGKKTGIRMDVEGRYKWIVFLPCKRFDVGALTRYYGVFDDGELKVRGIELRQRNTPEFLGNVQRAMLDIFKQADDAEQFHALIPYAIETVLDYGKQICDGEIVPSDLVFKTRISRGVTEYKVDTLVKSALLQLRDLGIQVEPGQYIRYIVTNEHAADYTHRVCVVESLRDEVSIDVSYYLRQIAKCAESVLVPFGYTLEFFETLLHQQHMEGKRDASVLPGNRAYQTCI